MQLSQHNHAHQFNLSQTKKSREEVQSTSEEAAEPSPQCSYLAGTQLHTARTMLQQLPAGLTNVFQVIQPVSFFQFTHTHMRTHTERERERPTLATPFGGYSLSFGSTHCLTLSSLNLGVA